MWIYLVSEFGFYDFFDGLGYQGVFQFIGYGQRVGGVSFAVYVGICGYFDVIGCYCWKKCNGMFQNTYNIEIKIKIYEDFNFGYYNKYYVSGSL